MFLSVRLTFNSVFQLQGNTITNQTGATVEEPAPNAESGQFKRKLSKREKKEKKKREKEAKLKGKENESPGKEGVAEKLYHAMPDTSFTRSISNPEAVMRRRRQQKLEQKLQQFRSKDGGPDKGQRKRETCSCCNLQVLYTAYLGLKFHQ